MVFYAGVAVAQWLVCGVQFLPGTPPSAKQEELVTQTQEFIPSSGRYPADEVQPEDEYCVNVCLVRKI